MPTKTLSCSASRRSNTVFVSKLYSITAIVLSALWFGQIASAFAQSTSNALGVFEGTSDIGEVVHPGVAQYDAAKNTYSVTAAGENMWSTNDAFYFVWKKVSGDVELSADIRFPQEGGRAHRKAVLVLKQDLAADGVYADAALHGSGLTALQYRRTKGATTQDIELNVDMPQEARIVKRGDHITMFLSMHGEKPHQAGAAIKLHFDEPFYVGIGVCSHDKNVTETAVFSNVKLRKPAPLVAKKAILFSALQTVQTEDNFRRSIVVRTERGRMGAANWTQDGQTLYFNRDGQVWKTDVLGAEQARVNVGRHLWCDDNHGLSPDNRFMAISCARVRGRATSVYVLPLAGGDLRQLTHEGTAEVHGWSPDGTMIAFAGTRNGHTDIYVLEVEGGKEMRLTFSGMNDGPDFGPDGKVYFNSNRSGTMQIWRMDADGTQAEQVTTDDAEDWFPHVSSDGKQMVYLSYAKGTQGHPADQDVALRIMNLRDGRVRVLVDLFGGEGTLNAPSWSPDNHHLVFTEYEMLPHDADGSAFVMVPPKPDLPVK
jgi:TolB protein